MLNHKNYVDCEFDYIYIFMGTPEKDNPHLSSLKKVFPDKVSIFSYDAKECDDLEAFIKSIMHPKTKQNGCIIFDDLMKELSKCEIVLDIFTKYSSHWSVTVIFTTQNVFYKGKNASQNVTLYRNTHVLVLFDNFLDASTLRNICSRISANVNSKELHRMLRTVIETYGYVVIRGDNKTPPALRFTSNYFAKQPSPHFLAFHPMVNHNESKAEGTFTSTLTS